MLGRFDWVMGAETTWINQKGTDAMKEYLDMKKYIFLNFKCIIIFRESYVVAYLKPSEKKRSGFTCHW